MYLELVLESFKKYASNNAFCINEVYYTYEQFENRIAFIQGLFNANGGSSSRRVAIITSESIDDYAAIFACWFLGYAYIPINPALPKERIAKIIEDADIDCVITRPAHADFIGDLKLAREARVITTNENDTVNNASVTFTESKPTDIAYILFTSGSTGVPKGVAISFSNVEHFLDSYYALGIQTSPKDGYLQMFELSFDVSVFAYLVPVLNGACAYTVPASGIKYLNVIKALKSYDITIAALVPSIVRYLKPYFAEIVLPGLKYCILTAEASNQEVSFEWKKCLPNAEVINLYGPTEATIWCTAYLLPNTVSESKSYNDLLSIGKPLKNVLGIVVNDDLAEVRPGEKGELLVCSEQLTGGYVNNEERNKFAFVNIDGARYYRTGDVCFIDNDGYIYYCGRIDDQVKVQGYRIELSEVDLVIKKHLPHLLTVVVKYQDKKDVTQIGLVVEGDEELGPSIINTLKEYLPFYMIPQKTLFLKTIPQNSSNKIDKAGLTKMFSV